MWIGTADVNHDAGLFWELFVSEVLQKSAFVDISFWPPAYLAINLQVSKFCAKIYVNISDPNAFGISQQKKMQNDLAYWWWIKNGPKISENLPSR